MLLVPVRHDRPVYDPVWLSESYVWILSVWGFIPFLIGFGVSLYWPALAANPWLRFVFITPLTAGVLIATIQLIRLRRDRIVKRELCHGRTDQIGDVLEARESEQFLCVGEELELIELITTMETAPSRVRFTTWTHYFVLIACSSWLIAGSIIGEWLGMPRVYVAAVFGLLLAVAIAWLLLFSVRYEIVDGWLRIQPLGLVARIMNKTRGTRLSGSCVHCYYNCGVVDVWNDTGRERIPLDGMVRRHQFVRALFKAAGSWDDNNRAGAISVVWLEHGDKSSLLPMVEI